MKDFLGNEIKIGDYITSGASGNGTCEYGMILYEVTGFTENGSVSVLRLKSSYSKGILNCKIVKTSLCNLNKCVIIQPHHKMIELFERAKSKTLTLSDSLKIADWLHGQKEMSW